LRPFVAAGTLLAALFAAGVVRAEGVELGVTFGIAAPFGAVGAGSPATTPAVRDVATTWLPIGLDAGYRLGPSAYLGGTLEWGPTVGLGNGYCGPCDVGYDLQVRAEVRFYLVPSGVLDPWLSLGFGWEVLHAALGLGSVRDGATYHGPILGNVQVGLDLKARAIAVGPYLGLSLAEFVWHSLDPPPAGETSSIDGRVVHEWFTFGLRGTYGP
jgi:hypothetical protein